jgi:hypothetical protein
MRVTNAQHTNCPTCICGKRARVQGDERAAIRAPGTRGPGTISWAEHMLAWSAYANRYGRDQSAQRICDRGGFGYQELTDLLGHEPTTWEPNKT